MTPQLFICRLRDTNYIRIKPSLPCPHCGGLVNGYRGGSVEPCPKCGRSIIVIGTRNGTFIRSGEKQ